MGVSQPASSVLAEAPCFRRPGFVLLGDALLNKTDKYAARARHCMDMAARARHDEDKRSWLLLAETWLDLIPERQRTTGGRFDAVVCNQGAGLEPSIFE